MSTRSRAWSGHHLPVLLDKFREFSQTRVWWALLDPLGRRVASRLPTKQPSVLVLSLPRSGSSWVGRILGGARDALYLREPVTRSAMRLPGWRPVVAKTLDLVSQRAADTAFAALPAFPANVVRFPAQWSLLSRSRRRLVVKEVNPLACDWFITRYRPRVIFLVRHPAAVALSHLKLGWISRPWKDPEGGFGGRSVNLATPPSEPAGVALDFWEQQGAFQGAALQTAQRALEGWADSRIIRYEELCADPMKTFRELYAFAGLHWDARVAQAVAESSQGGERSRAHKSRESRKMIDAWKAEVPDAAVDRLHRAYGAFGLPWYQTPGDW